MAEIDREEPHVPFDFNFGKSQTPTLFWNSGQMPPRPYLPPLPPAPSWYPGHMASFTRKLPSLLQNTHVVLEARDSRLPLSSINPAFERALEKWKIEKKQLGDGVVAERIIVHTKKDLVSEWGHEPLRRAMEKYFPNTRVLFTSVTAGKSIGALYSTLVSIAKENALTTPELNVLVVGMPNVGKSTLLNHLRSYGIRGTSSSAFRTSANPGLTRATSTRLKLSLDPLIYSVDSPGVMLPFLGKGDQGRERGVKLALIAGIKESLYNYEEMAAYLLYRLNLLNSTVPPYPPVLRDQGHIDSPQEFLEVLARRIGALRPGGEMDTSRAARWFLLWWRENGSILAAKEDSGWGFDFEWAEDESPLLKQHPVGSAVENSKKARLEAIAHKFDARVRRFVEELKQEHEESPTQEKKRERREMAYKRNEKRKRTFEARVGSVKKRRSFHSSR